MKNDTIYRENRKGIKEMKLEKFKQKDPKKIGITIFTIVCILLIAGVFFYTSFASFETHDEFNIIEGTVGDNGDLYFSFYVDDEISKTMPQKGEGYVLNKEKKTAQKEQVSNLMKKNGQ